MIERFPKLATNVVHISSAISCQEEEEKEAKEEERRLEEANFSTSGSHLGTLPEQSVSRGRVNGVQE
jgi:hypothetical protein